MRAREWLGILAKHPERVVFAMASLAFALQAIGFYDLRHDDAYITYRYGMNIALGNGAVFNPGERLLGTTSPGQMLLSAFFYHLVGQAFLPSAMALFGCVGWTAQALAIFFLFRRALPPAGALLVATCVAAGAASSGHWVALETNLATALVLWSLVCARESSWVGAAALAALAGIVRPDAHLLALILIPICCARLRFAAWRPAAVFLAITLSWVGFATCYYGSPIPQSAVAKFHHDTASSYLAHIFKHLAAIVSHDVATFLPWLAFVGAVVLLLRRDRTLWPLIAYALLHLLAYAYLRTDLRHTWHLYPAALIFVTVILAGIATLGQSVTKPAVRGLVYVALGFLCLTYGLASYRFAQSHPTAFWFGARDRSYRDVAAYLKTKAHPTDRVIADEVGTLAYYSGLSMIDLVGLVTRDPQLEFQHARWFVVDPMLRQPRAKKGVRFTATRFVVHLYDVRDLY